MAEILHHLGWCWNPIKNGVNYQPQTYHHQSHMLSISSHQPFPGWTRNAHRKGQRRDFTQEPWNGTLTPPCFGGLTPIYPHFNTIFSSSQKEAAYTHKRPRQPTKNHVPIPKPCKKQRVGSRDVGFLWLVYFSPCLDPWDEVYLPTWIVDFYGKLVEKYTSPMDPMGHEHLSHEKNALLLSIESWLINRGPCNGLLKSLYNWVV